MEQLQSEGQAFQNFEREAYHVIKMQPAQYSYYYVASLVGLVEVELALAVVVPLLYSYSTHLNLHCGCGNYQRGS